MILMVRLSKKPSLIASVLLFLLISSCKEVERIRQIPKFPESPITFEVKGDSITVHRHYVSRVKVDSSTFELTALEFHVLPTLTFCWKDSTLFDSVLSSVDSFNLHMTKNYLYVKPEPINIVVDDFLLFEELYRNVLLPASKKVGRFKIGGNTFGIITKRFIRNDKAIFFRDMSPYLSESALGFLEPLNRETSRQLDTIQFKISEILSDDYEIFTFSLVSGRKRVHEYSLHSNGNKVTTKQFAEVLTAIDKEAQFLCFFEKQENKIPYSNSEGINWYGDDRDGYMGFKFVENREFSIKIDQHYSLRATYPYRNMKIKHSSDLLYEDSSYVETQGRKPSNGERKIDQIVFRWRGITKDLGPIKSGFIVHKYDVIPFIEEQLKFLGLDGEERRLFRDRWVKELVKNEYSLVHFATDKYEELCPMTITPKTDTKIRFMFCFKGVDSTFTIDEQILSPVNRSGFTVVDWVGVNLDIKNGKE